MATAKVLLDTFSLNSTPSYIELSTSYIQMLKQGWHSVNTTGVEQTFKVFVFGSGLRGHSSMSYMDWKLSILKTLQKLEGKLVLTSAALLLFSTLSISLFKHGPKSCVYRAREKDLVWVCAFVCSGHIDKGCVCESVLVLVCLKTYWPVKHTICNHRKPIMHFTQIHTTVCTLAPKDYS